MRVTTDSKHYADIADAIREKTGEATTYKPEQMAAGIGDVYEAGKAAVNVAGVLKFVSNGGSVENLFYRADFQGMDEVTIEMPNSPESLSQMFAFVVGLRKVTLKNLPKQAYNGYRFMYGGTDNLTSIEELELPDGIAFSNWTNFARYAPLLKSIMGRIDLSECTVVTNCFQNCTSLEDVSFMPKTIPLSISFANSPNLSADSIDSIVNGLASVSGQTLTVHPNVAAKITETDVTGKGWTLAY